MRIILGSFKERISKLGNLNEEAELDNDNNNGNRLVGMIQRKSTQVQLKNLPWGLIRLADAQFLFLRAKLFKFVVFIFLDITFFILLIIKFNCCGLKQQR